MENNGQGKIELTNDTKSGHLLWNNGSSFKLNFNGIYYIFKKNGLEIIPLYIGVSCSKRNSMDNRIGKYIKWNKGRPVREVDGNLHRDPHTAAVYLRESGLSNINYDNVYVMWVHDVFLYNLGWKTMKLEDIESELIRKIKQLGNRGYSKMLKRWV